MAFFALPMALVGGLLAAYLFGGGIISLGSLVGFFTVLGIVARNGIMLIGGILLILLIALAFSSNRKPSRPCRRSSRRRRSAWCRLWSAQKRA